MLETKRVATRSAYDSALTEAVAEHIRADRLDAAEELLRTRVADGGGDAMVAKQMAMVALKRGKPDAAKDLLSQALEVNDRDADAYALLSTVYAAEGRTEAVLSCAQRAAAIDTVCTRHQMNLAIAEQHAGLLGDAVDRLEALATKDPHDAQIAYNLGTTYLAAGRPDLARAALQRAVQIDPTAAESWANLATAERGAGNFTAALAAIDHALLRDPLSPILLVAKAGIVADAGDVNKAMQLVDKAEVLRPGAVFIHAIRGMIAMRQGNWATAVRSFAAVVRQQPDDPAATTGLGAALHQKGDLAGSLIAWDRAQKLDEADVGVRRVRAELLLQLGRFEEAFELWAARRGTNMGATYVTSLEGVDRFLLLADPDPCVTIALLRYLPLITARFGVTIAAPDALAALIEAALPCGAKPIRVLRLHEPFDDRLAVVPMRQLPTLLADVTETSVFRPGPYLKRARCEPPQPRRPRIGLAIGGRPDPNRPTSLGEPFASAIESTCAKADVDVHMLTFDTPLAALHDQVSEVDLVIAVDGPIAHLAGALGCPLIVLLDAAGGWAWPRRSDASSAPPHHEPASPWYPGARALRQMTPGNRTPLLATLPRLIDELLAADRSGHAIQDQTDFQPQRANTGLRREDHQENRP